MKLSCIGGGLAARAGMLCVLATLAVFGIVGSAAGQTANGNMREVAVAATAFARGAPLPEWFDRQAELPGSRSSDPVVMRLADSHFRVDAVPVALYHRAIQVNESTALSEIGQYGIVFQPDYQRVELHWLKVHRGGQVLEKLAGASVRFYHDERSVNQGIYTGAVTAVVIPEDIRVGDTLEIIYSIIGDNPVFAGHYTAATAWETTVPVLKRRVILDLPIGRNVSHRLIGATQSSAPVVADRGGRRLVRYEADNLAALDQEGWVPPDVSAQSWIQFSEFRDWRDVGQWASGLFSVARPDDFALPDLGQSKDKAETLMRTLRFVQENVRYLSISIGENSHRPYPPAEVLERRYGDCKDKSLLLVSILRRLGIEAEPVLVSAQSRKGLQDLLPSSALFDHAIVRARVDGKTYFLDPTLQYQANRLESLGASLPGAEALVVRRDVRDLEVIQPRHPDELPTAFRREQVTVSKMDQPVDMRVEFTYLAEDAEAARRALESMSPAQRHKAYEGLLAQRYSRAELVGEPQISDDRDGNRLGIVVNYRIPGFFERQDDRWSLRYEASNMDNVLPVPNNARRRFPVFVGAYPWAARYQLAVTLPEDYDANYQPSTRSLVSEAFRLDETLKFKGRLLETEVALTLTRDRVGAAGTPQYLSDLQKANGYFRGSLFISDRNLRKTVAESLPLKELSRQRLEQALRNSAAAIAAGQAAGQETAAARCEHALAAAYLDQPDVAQMDIEAAVREQPASPDVLHCRGTVRFVTGDFEGSVGDLSRSLALGRSEADTYFRRGLAYYHARQWRKAADDFATFGSLSKDERTRARATIWQALAYRQGGATVPPPDAGLTGWPATVLEMLSDKARAEDVIERVNLDERGLQLEEATAEAYFYLSRYFATSNRGRARAYLRRSVDLGALYSLVQIAARNELRLIEGKGLPATEQGRKP